MSPKPSQCRYEEGKPGKRSKDVSQLRDALFQEARRQTGALFQCLDDDERGSTYYGDSKTRKRVSIRPYIDPSDLLVRISCSNLGCTHRRFGELRAACLLEGPFMLPSDLNFTLDLTKKGRAAQTEDASQD